MLDKRRIAGLLLLVLACKSERNAPDPSTSVSPPASPPRVTPVTAAPPSVPGTEAAPVTAAPAAAPPAPAGGEAAVTGAPSARAAATTPGGIAVEDGNRVQADCAFSGDKLRGEAGTTFQVTCPASCDQDSHDVYGTDIYTSDTPICKAGIHAGAIPTAGGVVAVRIEAGRPAYRGKDQHGLKSLDYGRFRRSFVIVTAANAARPAADPSLIEAGCSYGAGQLDGADGATYRVACPADCEKGGRNIYGTNIYTADSPICKAAIHSGAIKAQGGTVTVRLEPGQSSYEGGNQNGVNSRNYGKYKKSYAIVPAN